jgi:hypothetical protein
MEIRKEEAEKIVLTYVNSKYQVDNDEMVLIKNNTIEKPYGWIFFSESKRYFESKADKHRIWGNGPVLVEREFGRVIPFGTALPFERYIQQYERKRFINKNGLLKYFMSKIFGS